MKNIALALALLASIFVAPAFAAGHTNACCAGGTAACCQGGGGACCK
jgi:hypothetical protein